MKRLVSLLAIALVSSLFVTGCGKAKSCSEGNNKGDTFCTNSANFEGAKDCVWTPDATAGAKADAGTCADWVPEAADKAECEKFDGKEKECKEHNHGNALLKCHYSEGKCHVGKKPVEKKAATK